MAKSSYEKALDKQMKEAKKQADAAARRERAKSIIDGQPIKNGFRFMDGNAEQLLQIILDKYDGAETNRVWGDMDNVPQNLQMSFNLELEKLLMYGVLSSAHNFISGFEVYLSPQGKSYFSDKAMAVASNQNFVTEISHRKQYDVFISHANKDKLEYVDALYQSLSKLGINIFYDSKVLSWGDNWKNVILDGTAKSEFAIIVISKQFFGREWTEKELSEFLSRQNESGQKIILPLIHSITLDELKGQYPDLADLQALRSEDTTVEEIAILLAKELIKRYR